MPSESLRAVKRTRTFLRSILTENRRPQIALKTEASACLHHYPFDYNLNKYWSEDVCEHGNDREFCRECDKDTGDREQVQSLLSVEKKQGTFSKSYIGRLEGLLEELIGSGRLTAYQEKAIKKTINGGKYDIEGR